MSKFIRVALMATLMQSISVNAVACIFQDYSYNQLQREAEVIVIAEPIGSVVDGRLAPTGGKFYDQRGQEHDVMAKVVRTTFRVLTILKGAISDKFAISLFKDEILKTQNNKSIPSTCPPLAFMEFHPNAQERYLFFMVSEKSGKFSPVGGQSFVMPGVIKLVGGPH